MYHTYILQSQTGGQLYIGIGQTNNLSDRLERHNGNRNTATKGRGPWVLLYAQSFPTRAESMQLETKLKSWKNKEYLLSWIALQQQSS